MGTFKFDLLDDVVLSLSGEKGIVIARAEYSNAENSYYIRYCSAQGMQCENWWNEAALKKDPQVNNEN